MKNKLNTKLMHPRDQITLVIRRIYNRGMTTTSGGNISILDDDGDIWVTPAGIDKGALRPDDIVCIRQNGTVEGKYKPSSELPFHQAIYRKRPDIKAIIHAHPPALVSFSIVRQKPNTNLISQAKHVCGDIGYANYEVPGSNELGEIIAQEFEQGYHAVIMENHGTVIGGKDLSDSFQRFEALEFSARIIIYGSMIGQPKYLNDVDIKNWENQDSSNSPESSVTNYPSDERQRRKEIVNIVHRACEQGLMISSYGTVSMRWRSNDFLITPTDIPRWDLTLEDVVQIKNGKKEAGKHPSRATELHASIYKANPEVNSIIMTQSPYLMAFGATHEKLNVRTIPESWIFLQDIPSHPFGAYFGSKKADIIKDIPTATLIQNDCVIVTGNTLLNTFDYLEVAEFSAKSLVLGGALGKLHPIDDDQVKKLKEKFL